MGRRPFGGEFCVSDRGESGLGLPPESTSAAHRGDSCVAAAALLLSRTTASASAVLCCDTSRPGHCMLTSSSCTVGLTDKPGHGASRSALPCEAVRMEIDGTQSAGWGTMAGRGVRAGSVLLCNRDSGSEGASLVLDVLLC